MQGTQVRSLLQEDPTCLRAAKSMCLSYWGHTLEPTVRNYWAHIPRVCASQQEKPLWWEAHAPQLRAHVSQQRATVAENNKINKLEKRNKNFFKKKVEEDAEKIEGRCVQGTDWTAVCGDQLEIEKRTQTPNLNKYQFSSCLCYLLIPLPCGPNWLVT